MDNPILTTVVASDYNAACSEATANVISGPRSDIGDYDRVLASYGSTGIGMRLFNENKNTDHPIPGGNVLTDNSPINKLQFAFMMKNVLVNVKIKGMPAQIKLGEYNSGHGGSRAIEPVPKNLDPWWEDVKARWIEPDTK